MVVGIRVGWEQDGTKYYGKVIMVHDDHVTIEVDSGAIVVMPIAGLVVMPLVNG